jgi:ADP-heptose:LPS heptosyltransferase
MFFVAMVRVSKYVIPASRVETRKSKAEPEWRRLLAAASSDYEAFAARLSISADIRLRAMTTYGSAGGSDARAKIAVAPGSKMASKRWPQERFVQVVAKLHQRFPDYQFIVFGDYRDETLGDELVERYRGDCVNLAGRLSVLESAALLEQCAAYIGNDTGTMHLAAMVGCPCVAIFSSRDAPGRWDPIGQGHVVLRSDPSCAGCMLEECVERKNRCLTDISVDQVIDATIALLTTKGRVAPEAPSLESMELHTCVAPHNQPRNLRLMERDIRP